VDRLAQDLPRRLPPPASETIVETEPVEATVNVRPTRAEVKEPKRIRRRSGKKKVLLVWVGILATVATIIVVVRMTTKLDATTTSPQTPTTTSTREPESSQGVKPVTRPAPGADTKTKMQAAEEYTDRKDYSMAEDIYKQVLQAEPNNADAMKALASVLYREDKIEESAAVLEKLPKTN
jgi:hypothetical protein